MARPNSHDADVIVVGAGLAGLTAAHRLSEQGHRVLVVERDDEPGGRVRSVEWQDCSIELGAIFVAGQYRRLRRLLHELGMADRLDPLPNAFRIAIRRNGRWHHTDFSRPELEVPAYRGLSRREKLSLLRLLPPQLRVAPSLRFFDMATTAAVDDRALNDVVSREANRYLIGALTEVFCGASADEISLGFGVLGARFPLRRTWLLRGGMGSLPRELASRLSVSCGIEVEKVHIEAGGVVVTTHGGDFLHARAAVLATRAGEAAEIWPAAPDPVRRFLTTQPYTQGFGAFLRTSERVERLDRRGRSVLMDILPSSGGHGALLAAVYFNELAPSGGLVGLAATPEASRSGAAAEELAAGLESEFREMHAESPPEVTARLSLRWPIFVPWYPVGRARQLASLRSGLAPGPIQLAGDYLYGPLMEGAVRAGEAAAGRANLYLS